MSELTYSAALSEIGDEIGDQEHAFSAISLAEHRRSDCRFDGRTPHWRAVIACGV
jgi:hypothetical protein